MDGFSINRLKLIDRRLAECAETQKIQTPERGWINTIGTSINMTLEQLVRKQFLTRQGAKKNEECEASGAISINSLKEIAKAMYIQLFYGFVPNDDSYSNLINKKAEEDAKKIMLRTDQNMQLKKQGNNPERLKRAVEELAEKISQTYI